MTKHKTAYRSALRVLIATAFILLLPFFAMHLTDEVVWDASDFAVAGVLLVGVGVMHELAVRKAGSVAYRSAVGVALAAALLLVWLVGAVGVIGEDGDPADLMYGGVLAVAITGAIIARLQAEGMARALLATALVQALVAVIALVAGMHQPPSSSVSEILGLNGFFVVLFVGSAWLFRHSARKQPPDAAPQGSNRLAPLERA